MKLSKYFIGFLIMLILAGVAWYSGFKYKFSETHIETSQSVVLNRIENVIKFVAVEGHMSEIYSYKDYYYYDIAPFRKKALIRVNAKVSVGYDFEKLSISIDEKTKSIVIDSIPFPEILSLDHDLEYYDVDEGTFNNFSAKEFTKLNESAKSYMREKAKESELFDHAESQKKELIDMLKYLVEAAGWTFKVERNHRMTFLN